jgi:hypothetical protein
MGILCCFQSGADKLHDAAEQNKKSTSSHDAATLQRRYQDGGLASLVNDMVAGSGISTYNPSSI